MKLRIHILDLGKFILKINLLIINIICLLSITKFGEPVKIKISLSGTFAELRPDHFHGGIDIKGLEGTPVYAVEDGYVLKVESRGTGYGKVIYIKHKNGYVSIYGHLSSFNAQLNSFYDKETKKYKKSNLTLYFLKNEIIVKKGDKIGEIGNSGFSFGPHLHYEVRQLLSNKLVNPLFFGVRVKDCSAPKLKKLKLFQMDENRISRKEKIFYLDENKYFNIDTIECYSGKVGLAAQVFDVMEGNNNKNGVYQLKMIVNGKLKFHFSANKIPLSETRFANALIDYKENKKSNDIFYRCFRLPGYTGGSYAYFFEDGYFDVKQGQITDIEIEAIDYAGNYSRKKIAIRGKKRYLPPLPDHDYYIKRNTNSTIKTYFLEVKVPKGAIYQNVPLRYREINEIEEETFSNIHRIHDEYEPLHKDIFISIRSGIIPDYLREKAFISKCNPRGKYVNYGGKWRKDFLEGNVDELGEYSIRIDTIPPSIKDLSSFSKKGREKKYKIQFQITDNIEVPKTTDAPFFKVTLNGEWVRMESDRKRDIIEGYLPKDLKRGKQEIKVTCWDKMNNINHYTKSFVVW